MKLKYPALFGFTMATFVKLLPGAKCDHLVDKLPITTSKYWAGKFSSFSSMSEAALDKLWLTNTTAFKIYLDPILYISYKIVISFFSTKYGLIIVLETNSLAGLSVADEYAKQNTNSRRSLFIVYLSINWIEMRKVIHVLPTASTSLK